MMTEPSLTEFQEVAEQQILELIQSAGLTISERKAMLGQMPHMMAPETAVKLVADGLKVWLYEEEATYSLGDEDQRFERADFRDDRELLEVVLGALRDSLSKHSGSSR